MIHVCFLMFIHESLVCPEQLNCLLFFRKILHVLHILRFSSIFCIFEPFLAMSVWFWDPSFHTEGNWGTQIQLLKKVQTFTDAPEGNVMHSFKSLTFFSYFVEIYIFSHLVMPFGSNRRYLHVSQKTNKVQFTLIKFKKFSPPAINALYFLLEHRWMFEPFFNSCVWVS